MVTLAPASTVPVVTPRSEGLPCDAVVVTSGSWVSRQVEKAYLSSLNVCLERLGWVPRSILEVGCGDASLLAYLARTFVHARVVAVETDPDKLAIAQARHGCRVHYHALQDGESLPFDSRQFDLVISHGFLARTRFVHHWLGEMSRVSAEGLIVSTPFSAGLRCVRRLPGAGHIRLAGDPVCTPDKMAIPLRRLSDLLERAGASPEQLMTPVPFAMILARRSP